MAFVFRSQKPLMFQKPHSSSSPVKKDVDVELSYQSSNKYYNVVTDGSDVDAKGVAYNSVNTDSDDVNTVDLMNSHHQLSAFGPIKQNQKEKQKPKKGLPSLLLLNKQKNPLTGSEVQASSQMVFNDDNYANLLMFKNCNPNNEKSQKLLRAATISKLIGSSKKVFLQNYQQSYFNGNKNQNKNKNQEQQQQIKDKDNNKNNNKDKNKDILDEQQINVHEHEQNQEQANLQQQKKTKTTIKTTKMICTIPSISGQSPRPIAKNSTVATTSLIMKNIPFYKQDSQGNLKYVNRSLLNTMNSVEKGYLPPSNCESGNGNGTSIINKYPQISDDLKSKQQNQKKHPSPTINMKIIEQTNEVDISGQNSSSHNNDHKNHQENHHQNVDINNNNEDNDNDDYNDISECSQLQTKVKVKNSFPQNSQNSSSRRKQRKLIQLKNARYTADKYKVANKVNYSPITEDDDNKQNTPHNNKTEDGQVAMQKKMGQSIINRDKPNKKRVAQLKKGHISASFFKKDQSDDDSSQDNYDGYSYPLKEGSINASSDYQYYSYSHSLARPNQYQYTQQQQQYDCTSTTPTPGPGSYIQLDGNLKDRKCFRSKKDKFSKIFGSPLQRFSQDSLRYQEVTYVNGNANSNVNGNYNSINGYNTSYKSRNLGRNQNPFGYERTAQAHSIPIQSKSKSQCFLSKSPKFAPEKQNNVPPIGSYNVRQSMEHDIVRNLLKNANTANFSSCLPRFGKKQSKSNQTPGPGFYDIDALERAKQQELHSSESFTYKSEAKRHGLDLEVMKSTKLQSHDSSEPNIICQPTRAQSRSIPKNNPGVHQPIHKREQLFQQGQFFKPYPFMSGSQRFTSVAKSQIYNNEPPINYDYSSQLAFPNKKKSKQKKSRNHAEDTPKPSFNSTSDRKLSPIVGQGVGVGLYDLIKGDQWIKKSSNVIFN